MASSSDQSRDDLPGVLTTDTESGRQKPTARDKTSAAAAAAAVAAAETAEVRHYAPLTDDEKHLDQRINAKLDAVVLLILSISFVLCGIDKTNIGFVATSTFIKDANLTPDDIPNSLSLFSATYVPLQPLSVYAARRLGPARWLPALLITWGIISQCHALIRSSATLMALRLLLGAAEAGFTQSALYYLSTLYPKFALGWRMGLFSGMYSVAGAFAGLLAYALLGTTSSGLKGWQVVFIVEGTVTVFVGIVALVLLPRDVGRAWFLSEAERRHAVARMERDVAGGEDGDGEGCASGGVALRDVVDVVMDWKKMLILLCNIMAVLPVTAFTTFLPLIVQGMDYSGTKATLMSTPPFIVGVAGLLILVYSSDRLQERSLHTVLGMTLGLVGCLVMVLSDDSRLRYGFTHVCLSGVFAAAPLVTSWLTGNTPRKDTRSVLLGLNGWTNIAGVIAGQLFKSRYAPSYKYPLTVTMILVALGMLGFLFVRGMYMLENRKRRRITATWDEDRFAEEMSSTKRRGDQRLTWIYGY